MEFQAVNRRILKVVKGNNKKTHTQATTEINEIKNENERKVVYRVKRQRDV
jgi:hypothetical protein